MTAIIPTLPVFVSTVAAEAPEANAESRAAFEAIFENAQYAAPESTSAPELPDLQRRNAPADHHAKTAELALALSDMDASVDEAEDMEMPQAPQPQPLPTSSSEIAVSFAIQAAPLAQETRRASAPAVNGADPLQPLTAQVIPSQPVAQSDATRAFRCNAAVQKDAAKATSAVQIVDQSAAPAKSEQLRMPKLELPVERPATPPAQIVDIPPLPTSTAALAPAQTAVPVAIIAPTPTEPPLHLNLTKGDLWLDQLAREILSVVGDGGKLRFSLTPEALGQLDVHIEHRADGVAIEFHPSTDAARQIIMAEQPRLSEELRQSGIRTSSSELASGSGGQGTTQRDGTPSHQAPHRHAPHSLPHRAAPQPTPTRRQGRFA